jgi:hypothetical protein
MVPGKYHLWVSSLILLYIVFAMSHSSVFEDKINELIGDGVILFVCCSISGAIVVEFWVSDFFYTSNQIVWIFMVPCAMLCVVSLEYILILLHYADKSAFNMSSLFSRGVISFSIIYCIFIKINYYVREDAKND